MATKAEPRLNPFELDARELITLIEGKRPQAIGNWRELGGEEYARSFTAAGTIGYDIVGDLHREFLAVLREPGATERDFVARVMPILRRKGWLSDKDDAEAARRLLLIYDTNLRTAQATGRWARIQKIKTALPYLYSFTGADERVRHPPKSPLSDHRAFEGILLPVDHPFWQDYFPPLGFRCRCQVVQKTRGQAARLGEVTDEAELRERTARLGRPWGFSPGRRSLAGVEQAAGRANEKRPEGAPPISVHELQAAGRAAWDAAMKGQAGKGFRSPINPEVRAETIKVESKAVVVRRLERELAEAAKDERYYQQREFRGRNESQWGRAKFSDQFDDKAVSMIAAIKPELDDLAKQIGVPPVRGFVSLRVTSKHGADMGDGVMGFQPPTFNFYSRRIGSKEPAPNLANIGEQRSAIKKEIDPLQNELDKVMEAFDANRRRYSEIATIRDRPGALEILAERNALLEKIETLMARDRELQRAAMSIKPASDWTPGRLAAKRPYNSADYQAEALDKARTLMFHEFGHHVHQMLNKRERRRLVETPLEAALTPLFRDYMLQRKGKGPTGYSEGDKYEWFAENFAVYVMGRKDLVDKEALKLIERIFNGKFA